MSPESHTKRVATNRPKKIPIVTATRPKPANGLCKFLGCLFRLRPACISVSKDRFEGATLRFITTVI
jgi:hypothetical protein